MLVLNPLLCLWGLPQQRGVQLPPAGEVADLCGGPGPRTLTPSILCRTHTELCSESCVPLLQGSGELGFEI